MSIAETSAAYGDACAAFYDRLYAPPSAAQIARLRELAGNGSAFELGIGTGRVALPLAASGVRVGGIEASPAMRAELRQRDSDEHIEVCSGNFAESALGGPHRLIFALVGTLSLLPSRDAQRACLRNVAAHLETSGHFLYECSDRVDQAGEDSPLHMQHRLLIDGEVRDYPVRTLALSLNMLDAMAADAGLLLHARWGDWRGAPWHDGARQTISLYRPRADCH